MRVHVLILCGIWFCRKLSRRCCLFCLSMMRIFGVQTRWNDWHNFAFYFLVCARCFCVCVLFFIWNDNQQLRMAAKSIRKYHTIEKINHVNKIKRKKIWEEQNVVNRRRRQCDILASIWCNSRQIRMKSFKRFPHQTEFKLSNLICRLKMRFDLSNDRFNEIDDNPVDGVTIIWFLVL